IDAGMGPHVAHPGLVWGLVGQEGGEQQQRVAAPRQQEHQAAGARGPGVLDVEAGEVVEVGLVGQDQRVQPIAGHQRLEALDLGLYALAWQVGAPSGPATVPEFRRDLGRRMRISRATLTMLNYSRPNLPPECRRALEPGYGLIDPCG